MFLTLIFLLFILLCFIRDLNAHAVIFTYPSYCSGTRLEAGVTVMGSNMVAESQGRTMIIKRNGVTIPSGSIYVPGESLTVSVSSFTLEAVFQATGMTIIVSLNL